MNIIMSYFCFLSVQTVSFLLPYQLTFCPRNKFKNLTVGIFRTHLK